jgi:hypothetical protein
MKVNLKIIKLMEVVNIIVKPMIVTSMGLTWMVRNTVKVQ